MSNTYKAVQEREKLVCTLRHSLVVVIMLMVLTVLAGPARLAYAADGTTPSITYRAHVQNIGWMSWVSDGETAGTTGRALQVEAVNMNVSGLESGSIRYQAHLTDIGWQGWKNAGNVAGTTGKNRKIEAIRIELTSDAAAEYDVLYRAHVPDMGWLAWTKNGAVAGSTGMNTRIEAIQVKLAPKGTEVSGVASLSKPTLTASAHSADIGWQAAVGEGATIGTTGRGLRLEAVKLSLSDFGGAGAITARAHVGGIGWMGWVGSGEVVGTTGRSLAMEAIEIKLTGNVALFYDVYYRAHVADYGWMGWARNGETAGSTGLAKQMEAIEVRLVRKGTAFDRGGSAAVQAGSGTTAAPGYANPIRCSSARWSTSKESGCQHDVQNVSIGTPVYAIADGNIVCQQKCTVISGTKYLVSYGNVINFTSSDGKTTAIYAHLNGFEGCSQTIPSSMTQQWSATKCKVSTIDCGSRPVKRGELIGYVGTTSNSSGAHLHFELRIGGNRVNPPAYVSIN